METENYAWKQSVFCFFAIWGTADLKWKLHSTQTLSANESNWTTEEKKRAQKTNQKLLGKNPQTWRIQMGNNSPGLIFEVTWVSVIHLYPATYRNLLVTKSIFSKILGTSKANILYQVFYAKTAAMGGAVSRTRGFHSYEYSKKNQAITAADSCPVLLCSYPLIPKARSLPWAGTARCTTG